MHEEPTDHPDVTAAKLTGYPRLVPRPHDQDYYDEESEDETEDMESDE